MTPRHFGTGINAHILDVMGRSIACRAHPDQPFIPEWYYNGATTGLLISGAKAVPMQMPKPPRPPTDDLR